VRGFREGCLHRGAIAALVLEREVAGDVGVELRHARAGRGVETDHRGQLAVFDRDVLGGVLRERQRIGNDERDRLADVEDLA